MQSKQPTKASQEVIPGIPLCGVSRWTLTQNRIALITVILVLALIAYPPWRATAPNGRVASIAHFPVFSARPSIEYKYPSIDYGRLFLEAIVICTAGSIGVFLTRDRKPLIQTSE